MTDEPNLSQERIQKLVFIRQAGNQLIYQGPSKKVVVLGLETVKQLGMADSHLRKRRPISKQIEEDIWSGTRTCQNRDRQATAKLIELLKQYQVEGEFFSSKKSRRRETWAEIASKLMEAGFHFTNKDTAWQKVSQKWRNLERTYRAQLANVKTNGESSRHMEFFEDLHELLSKKFNADGSLVDANNSLLDEEESNNEEVDDLTELTADMDPAVECYDTYVDNEILLDDKSLVFGMNYEGGLPGNSHTESVRDPVLRLMLEMRAQERAHFREDRRERLKLQRETLQFQKDLVEMLNTQHQERMDAMYALIDAIKGADYSKKNFDFKRLDRTSLELNLPNGKRKRKHSDDESSSSQSSSRKSIR